MSDAISFALALRDSMQANIEKRTGSAQSPGAIEASDLATATEGGWTTLLAPTVNWLRAQPALWLKATRILAKRFDTPAEDSSAEPSVSSRLLTELFRENSLHALAFLGSIEHEASLREFGAALPWLVLETDVAVALLGLCSRLRGNGQLPALADKLSIWAANNSTQAQQIVDDRVGAPDRDAAMHIWAVEPLVEGLVSAGSAADTKERKTWRDDTLASLLDSPSPLRQGLAAYLSCVAWPTGSPIEERHAALLSLCADARLSWFRRVWQR